ncbi:hypothetical protein GCM10011403_16340 [Pseudohongiella nitratireducens]|jgi:hypothetical protein|uniref:Uncharacterized protein n=1 Tax=Pseudohongiella nitratireducens TaxID=1768907 RepID=A0A917GWU9_9GAMM|nr:hypothetical protein [Pseudohongiella nitratireducens]MDF1621984.1 hypothetical protein [Pseudohongiella nitratireducens]GGG59776.1 hypothetical protein GCM10011403_16340 [Pseudohongiella nitratireducens]
MGEYQNTISLIVVGLIIISILYIGLHTDLVQDVSGRRKRKKKS